MDKFIYEHRVQYYETDKMKCVHHSNYIRWFEEARTYFLDDVGYGYFKMEENGILSPVLRVESNYKSMVHFGDVVDIEVTVGSYSGSRIEFVYNIYDRETGVLRNEGKTFHCFINESGRPVSLRKHLPELHKIMEDFVNK